MSWLDRLLGRKPTPPPIITPAELDAARKALPSQDRIVVLDDSEYRYDMAERVARIREELDGIERATRARFQ